MKKHIIISPLLSLSWVSLVGIAVSHAQPYAPPPPPPQHTDDAGADSLRSISITFSPTHLFLPVLEVTAEFRFKEKMSFAGILGAGKIGVIELDGTSRNPRLLEIGGQFRYYATGDFESGLHVGGEVLYLDVATTDQGSVQAAATGLAIGPMIGYKWTAGFGLVLEAQAGAEYQLVAARATDGTASGTASGSDVVPLINLNAGFSF